MSATVSALAQPLKNKMTVSYSLHVCLTQNELQYVYADMQQTDRLVPLQLSHPHPPSDSISFCVALWVSSVCSVNGVWSLPLRLFHVFISAFETQIISWEFIKGQILRKEKLGKKEKRLLNCKLKVYFSKVPVWVVVEATSEHLSSVTHCTLCLFDFRAGKERQSSAISRVFYLTNGFGPFSSF